MDPLSRSAHPLVLFLFSVVPGIQGMSDPISIPIPENQKPVTWAVSWKVRTLDTCSILLSTEGGPSEQFWPLSTVLQVPQSIVTPPSSFFVVLSSPQASRACWVPSALWGRQVRGQSLRQPLLFSQNVGNTVFSLLHRKGAESFLPVTWCCLGMPGKTVRKCPKFSCWFWCIWCTWLECKSPLTGLQMCHKENWFIHCCWIGIYKGEKTVWCLLPSCWCHLKHHHSFHCLWVQEKLNFEILSEFKSYCAFISLWASGLTFWVSRFSFVNGDNMKSLLELVEGKSLTGRVSFFLF